MSLPKIQYPIFQFILPSTKETIKFRPFTVKEEKLLLIAQESDNQKDRLGAFRQIVNNCSLNLSKDIGELPSFDLEYAFLKIRSKSVGNTIDLKYKDLTDEQIYTFEVDLDELEITYDDNHTNNIMITDELGFIMTYPTVEMLDDVDLNSENTDSVLSLVKKCIKTIYDENNTYNPKDYTEEEINSFVEDIPAKAFEKVTEFFNTMPVLKHDLKYKDSAGTEKTITLQGIDDFFQ